MAGSLFWYVKTHSSAIKIVFNIHINVNIGDVQKSFESDAVHPTFSTSLVFKTNNSSGKFASTTSGACGDLESDLKRKLKIEAREAGVAEEGYDRGRRTNTQ